MATLPAGFSADNARKPYSLTNPEPGVLRFEVRKGDVFTGFDDRGNERNEIKDGARYPADEPISIEYEFMVEEGGNITSNWAVVGQLHSALNVTPPVEICFQGSNRLKIIGKSGSSSNRKVHNLFTDTQDIERGRLHRFRLDLLLGTAGRAIVWRDGVKIVDYAGPLGYTDQTKAYWRCGIYRSTAPETLAVQFKGMRIYHNPSWWGVEETAPEPVPEPVEPAPIEEEDYLVDMVLSMGAWAQSVEDRLKALETK